MARYHLYYLAGGRLIGSDDIEADGDGEAIRIAEREGRGDLVEIWNSESRVRTVIPGGARMRDADEPGDRQTAPAPA